MNDIRTGRSVREQGSRRLERKEGGLKMRNWWFTV